MKRRNKIVFADTAEANHMRRYGFSTTGSATDHAAVAAEAEHLSHEPANRHERRGRAKRLKAFLRIVTKGA